ncbi:MAG: response regulator [Melioribacteraceae bacterium]|nr:response regulator [Melioribacteraceae bacterium]MCO6474363.1 response regulator [Melioribacteraceae bacterium]MDD3558493.1 response regulator [Melioribacteraceae bacterium]
MFKVLVVDDDPNINLFISRLLKKKFNCEVESSLNGKEALEMLESEAGIDVVFLDVTMPVMDGIETLRIMKESETIKNIPVIMLTAVSERSVIDRVTELGVHSYLVKPLMYESSYNKIKEIFEELKPGITGS